MRENGLTTLGPLALPLGLGVETESDCTAEESYSFFLISMAGLGEDLGIVALESDAEDEEELATVFAFLASAFLALDFFFSSSDSESLDELLSLELLEELEELEELDEEPDESESLSEASDSSLEELELEELEELDELESDPDSGRAILVAASESLSDPLEDSSEELEESLEEASEEESCLVLVFLVGGRVSELDSDSDSEADDEGALRLRSLAGSLVTVFLSSASDSLESLLEEASDELSELGGVTFAFLDFFLAGASSISIASSSELLLSSVSASLLLSQSSFFPSFLFLPGP